MTFAGVISVALFALTFGSGDSQVTKSLCVDATLSLIDRQSFTADLNNFAVEMYKISTLQQQNDRTDSVFSPASIAFALGIVLQGADGVTRAEIKAALVPNIDNIMLSASFDQLLSALNSATNQYELSTANKLYIKQGFELLSSFEERVVNCFHTTSETMDVSDPEATTQQVNSWVEEQTKSKITNLISPAIVTPYLRLLIVNAIYFKGEWATPFTTQHGANTAKNTFTGIDGRRKETDFMSMTNNFLFVQDSSTSVLGIPYKNDELHMFLFLPTNPAGFADFEASLTSAKLSKLMDAAKNTRVQVMIPKFTTKSEYPLKNVLTAAGMKTMFDPMLANLTAISSSSTGDKLFVGEAKHKAFIEVNEKGTEAAAATFVAIMTLSAAINQPTIFFANRPFVFAIRHASSGAIVFM
uniref:Serpin domain-containing protein n=1 Tax=Plectus sambesii TaxID=2011161 RepID=A0A914UI55_9BILA